MTSAKPGHYDTNKSAKIHDEIAQINSLKDLKPNNRTIRCTKRARKNYYANRLQKKSKNL